MDSDQLKNLLKSYHLKPNFTYGQNFLVDDFVLQDIVDAAEVTSTDANLSILAISVQLFGQPEIVQIVQAKSFYPAPKVDSAVIKINLDKKAKYNLPDEARFFKILKACFAGKRKQIHNTLVGNLHLEKL